MLIQKKIAHKDSFEIGNRNIDYWDLEWYESSKRIIRKKTEKGIDISFKSLNEDPNFKEGDVIFENEITVTIVRIIPTETIIIKPKNNYELATLCYEIGNKHLPLFFENDELLIPFEKPIFQQFQVQGYSLKLETRKLSAQLRTSVSGHTHQNNGTLFSKIMKLTGNE